MSKRGGTELNHENWNQEEEAEEAGTFRKAAEGEMKGRVIKRARRRNVGGEEGEKKNVFAGFGGFASKPSATDTFSFIGGPPSTEPAKPAKLDSGGGAGFVFGSSKPTGGAASAGFSFGSISSSSAPAKTSFAFGSGNSEGGGNEKAAPSVFGAFGGVGETKKDSGNSAPPLFGSAGETSDSSASAAPAPTTFGSFAFGAKKTDSDTISTKPTQISEPVSKASETPSEPIKEKESVSFGATSGFKFGSSSSEVKVSSESSSSSTGFTFGAVSSKSEAKVAPVGGFAFGANSSEKPASSSGAGGFSFGSKTEGPKEKSVETPSESGFAFGSKSDEKEKTASSGFSFGAKTSVEKPADKTVGFNFSSSSVADKSSPAAGFTFGAGSKTEEPEAKKTEEVDEDKGEDDDKSEVVEDDVPSKEYLSHLKALNLQVLAWLKQHIDQNPLVLLSPVFRDYDSHLEQLTSKYGKQTNGKSEPKPSSSVSTSKTDVKVSTGPEVSTQPPLGQAAFGSIAPSKSSSPFSFGSAVADSQKPVSSTAPFSFGQVAAVKPALAVTFTTPVFGTSNSSTTGGTFGTAGSSFSFGLTAGTTTTAAPTADAETAEEEDTPPVVEIKQVTEEDAVYSKKCKLFYKKDGNYVEKGVGMLYLKEVEGGDRTQLLVRADTNLGNVLLNILLSPQIPTTRVGKNNVMLVCVPNPPVDPKADVSAPCPMLIRVKSGEDADELKEKLDELKEDK